MNARTIVASIVTHSWATARIRSTLSTFTSAAKGGETSPANLALACFGCNSVKGTETTAIDPLTQTAVPLYHPRQDRWADHFRWSSNCTELIGISAIGRATISLLDLNRPGLRRLRQVLYAANEHPPASIDDDE